MLDLILFPFRLVFSLIAAAGRLIGGVFSLVFGILGGVLSLAVSLGGLLLVGGLIALAIQRRKEYRAHQDQAQDDFVSFYDKENRVE
ncbi:MAG: hypothetical protein SOY30_08805 [Eubacteriales bacterium]|nr:hypothetical protein [Eubacteriales bacterium]